MTRFGKFLDRGLKSLAAEAIDEALKDAGIEPSQIQAAYMGNGAAGVTTGQVLIRARRCCAAWASGASVVNVENACATSATAFQQAAQMITLGLYDVVLVCGFEKLYNEDKRKTFSVFQGAVDLERSTRCWPISRRTCWPPVRRPISKVPVQALAVHGHLREHGAFVHAAHRRDRAALRDGVGEELGHGSLNPKAQYQDKVSVEDVLAAQMISDPLTLLMCSPIGDGAAALVLVSEKKAKQLGLKDRVRVLSSVLATGFEYADGEQTVPEYAAQLAYEAAGIGPQDLDVVELHDASSPAELIYYEYLGLAKKNEGVALVESGATSLGGRIPVNPSGGLLRKVTRSAPPARARSSSWSTSCAAVAERARYPARAPPWRRTAAASSARTWRRSSSPVLQKE